VCMKRQILIFTLCLLAASPAYAYRVKSVYDGDSFHVAEFPAMVRVFAIDAPERRPPPWSRKKSPPQPYSVTSRDFLRALILDKDVTLSCDHGTTHNRPVCQVFLNGEDIALKVVEAGLAFDEPRFSGGVYKSAEEGARKKGIGLWNLPDGGQRPWSYRSGDINELK
jgi:micrococcal nuclease